MNVLRLILVLLLSLHLPALAAERPPLERVIRAVERPFDPGAPQALTDVAARFTQESHIVTLDTQQQAKGALWLQFDRSLPATGPQARFRWIYQEPTEQLFVSDGATIWVYLPDNNQVIVSPASGLEQQPGAQNPVTLLTGLDHLQRDFQVDWAPEGVTAEGDYQLVLVPKQNSAYLARILLQVDGAAVRTSPAPAYFPLKGLMVEDANGNQTRIRFRELQVNKGVNAELFHFIPPAGVDLLRPEDINPGG